jgi:hypothetical protein
MLFARMLFARCQFRNRITPLGFGPGILGNLESQVHFYDEREKAPLCGSPIPPPWGWTANRAKVTCSECLRLLVTLPVGRHNSTRHRERE